MILPLILSKNPVVLAGGGVADASDLKSLCGPETRLVAADGGARLALEAGLIPSAVIGDFDSLDALTREKLDPATLHHVTEQDSTDFEKAMSRIDAPLVVAVGFTGARIDHELAVFHGMLRFSQQPCVLLAEREVILHMPPTLTMSLERAETVSLFPLKPVIGRSIGLRWPIDGLEFAPGKLIGTSNEAVGGGVRIEMDGPGMIGLFPRRHLRQLMSALLVGAPDDVRWPAL